MSIISDTNPRPTVYLTAVGGGEFGNELSWIIDAISIALTEYKKYPLNIILVHHIQINEIFKELETIFN